MKRYRYPTKNDPESFSAALEYLKMTQEFNGTPKEFFCAQDVWSPIPMHLDMYFMDRPYLEIMGLQGLVDKELKRIGVDKYYPYNEKYGYYAPVYGSGNNIIQIPCPEYSPLGDDPESVNYNDWETNKDAIEWLKNFIVEEIPTEDLKR
jgi:hypothetical protein